MNNIKGKTGNNPPGQPLNEPIVKLGQYELHCQFDFLLGRLKTLVDATISDPVQNKAFKDLMAQDVWHRYNYILEITDSKGKIVNDGEIVIA